MNLKYINEFLKGKDKLINLYIEREGERDQIACYKGDNLLNKRTKYLVPVDTEININLKIATQKADVI